MFIKITLGEFLDIHNVNYSHDNIAVKIAKRLEASLGFNRDAIIPFNNETFGYYCEHIELIEKQEIMKEDLADLYEKWES